MTKYLSRIARTEGAVAIRPRVRSHYEPAPPAPIDGLGSVSPVPAPPFDHLAPGRPADATDAADAADDAFVPGADQRPDTAAQPGASPRRGGAGEPQPSGQAAMHVDALRGGVHGPAVAGPPATPIVSGAQPQDAASGIRSGPPTPAGSGHPAGALEAPRHPERTAAGTRATPADTHEARGDMRETPDAAPGSPGALPGFTGAPGAPARPHAVIPEPRVPTAWQVRGPAPAPDPRQRAPEDRAEALRSGADELRRHSDPASVSDRAGAIPATLGRALAPPARPRGEVSLSLPLPSTRAREPDTGPAQVTVTIDRIEVRGPAPGATAVPRSAERQPRRRPQSLQDYMRARPDGRIR